MISVSRPTQSLVRLASVLTIFCLTASLASAAESQPRWVINEVEWFGEIAPCFGFSVSETARRWRRLQAAAEPSTLTGPDLRRFFSTLAILTHHAQSTPADAAAALQIFETGFNVGHLTTGDVRTLNVALPGARALMAQGLGGTPEKLESVADIGALFTSVAAAALGGGVAKLATVKGQGSTQCGYWSGSTPAPPPDSTKGGVPTKPLGTAEVEQYIASIKSVDDVKRRIRNALDADCGTGACVDVNASEICDLVAALDVCVDYQITGSFISVDPKTGVAKPKPTIPVSQSDIKLMKLIFSQCKPTNYQYWKFKSLLHVGYTPSKDIDATIRKALGAKSQ
jgi:hypothetical protein